MRRNTTIWELKAKKELLNYNSIKRSIKILEERIELINIRMQNCRSANFSSQPKSVGEKTVDDVWCDAIIEKDMTERQIAEKKMEVTLIEKGLSALAKNEYEILSEFYINRSRNSMDNICEKLNIERSTVYKLINSALRHYILEEYGAEI